MAHTVCTGTGEYITRSGLARALGKAFEALEPVDPTEDIDPHVVMQKILIDEFWSELNTETFSFDVFVFLFL